MKKFSKQDKAVWLFILYIVFLAITSVAIVLMPYANLKAEETLIPLRITGGCFWLGIIGAFVGAFLLNQTRKKDKSFRMTRKKKYLVGAICFFQNPYGMIADIATGVTGIIFIILLNAASNLYIQFAFMALFIFSMGMHCMLNGICFKYVYFKKGVK